MRQPPRPTGSHPSIPPGIRLIPLLVVLALVATGCVREPVRSPVVAPDSLDRTITPNTFLEEGALVSFAVNTDSTRRREKSPYVPIGIAVANNGRTPITMTRESFVLVDDAGRRYPVATVNEAKTLGTRMVQDLRASRTFADIFPRRVLDRPRVRSVFFPIQVTEPGFETRGIVSDTIELPRDSWMIDVIYFPHPEGELRGRRYELWFSPEGLDEPVFVRFVVR